MNYRRLGKTGLMVSEVGFGAEWMERHTANECRAVLTRAQELGINILDCWMSEPNVRTSLGLALKGQREHWYIQGHIGSTWQNGQYVRTRDVAQCRIAFEDLLTRLQTDYIDLGMMHFIDQESDWNAALTIILPRSIRRDLVVLIRSAWSFISCVSSRTLELQS